MDASGAEIKAVRAFLSKAGETGDTPLLQRKLKRGYDAFPAVLDLLDALEKNNPTTISTKSYNKLSHKQSGRSINEVLEWASPRIELKIENTSDVQRTLRLVRTAQEAPTARGDLSLARNSEVALVDLAQTFLEKGDASDAPEVILVHHSLTLAKSLIYNALRRGGKVTAYVADPFEPGAYLPGRILAGVNALVDDHREGLAYQISTGSAVPGGQLRVISYSLPASLRTTVVKYGKNPGAGQIIWGYYVHAIDRQTMGGLIPIGHGLTTPSLIVRGDSPDYAYLCQHIDECISKLVSGEPNVVARIDADGPWINKRWRTEHLRRTKPSVQQRTRK